MICVFVWYLIKILRINLKEAGKIFLLAGAGAPAYTFSM
jgi:hypothetical protein